MQGKNVDSDCSYLDFCKRVSYPASPRKSCLVYYVTQVRVQVTRRHDAVRYVASFTVLTLFSVVFYRSL